MEKKDLFRSDYKVENRKVKNIKIVKENERVRVIFEVDGENFPSYDRKTSEKIQTNSFSLDIANVGLQCGELKEFKRANRYLLGANLTPIIIASVLDNATISFDRIFKAKDSVREDGKTTYNSDLYKTVITSVVTNMDDFAIEDYKDAINTLKEAANRKQEVTTTTTKTTFGLNW